MNRKDFESVIQKLAIDFPKWRFIAFFASHKDTPYQLYICPRQQRELESMLECTYVQTLVKQDLARLGIACNVHCKQRAAMVC